MSCRVEHDEKSRARRGDRRDSNNRHHTLAVVESVYPVKIVPLRNMVLVRLDDEHTDTASGLAVVRDPRVVRPAVILAVGPEVRDVREGQRVMVNTVVATVIGDELLIPEYAILGTIDARD